MIQICIILCVLSWILQDIYEKITEPRYLCLNAICDKSTVFHADLSQACEHVLQTGHVVYQFGFDENGNAIRVKMFRKLEEEGFMFVMLRKVVR